MRELLHKRIRDTFLLPQFNTDVMKPLNIEALLDQEVLHRSSAICSFAYTCFHCTAHMEPSAYEDNIRLQSKPASGKALAHKDLAHVTMPACGGAIDAVSGVSGALS